VAEVVLPTAPEVAGWRHIYSGKVRNLYEPVAPHPRGDVVLVVASDRISAYDWVLPTEIPGKGAILTALTLWWFDQIRDLVPDHTVEAEVPAEVAGRAMVCQRLDMFPVECVARGYLTGSGLVEYNATGAVCGVALPSGLVDGSRLPAPIFTPATKAALGDHDENVSFDAVAASIGRKDAETLRDLTLQVYSRAHEIAASRGVILADTKFEFGREGTGRIVIGDEVLTPDSSRFWPADSWEPGRAQPSYDKQFVRDWLTSPESGWDRASDIPPPALPEAVVAKTRQRYLEMSARGDVVAAIAQAIPSPAHAGHPLRVAIDGVDAAGKTTLRRELAQVLRDRGQPVWEASIDDFHHPRAVRYHSGHDDWKGYWHHAFDLARLTGELLVPLGPGGDLRFRVRCHDLATDQPLHDEPWLLAEGDEVVLIDGVLAQRPELRDYWDFVIFVYVGFDEAYRRMAMRDHVAADPTHPDNARCYGVQRYYLSTYQPDRSADILIDNSDVELPHIVRGA
jgi:phosphoribosylaminoimidazole-succinocarboxamide synthase